MKFNVIGADRDTGEDIEMTIDAADQSAAEEVAHRKGIMVSRIAQALATSPPATQVMPAPQPLEQGHHRGAPVVNIATPRRGSSLGVASFVLGILAFLICWIPFVNLLGVPLSALGLVLGLVGMLVAFTRKGASIGYPIAGSAVCGLALFIAIGMTGALVGGLNEVNDGLARGAERRNATNQTAVAPIVRDVGSSKSSKHAAAHSPMASSVPAARTPVVMPPTSPLVAESAEGAGPILEESPEYKEAAANAEAACATLDVEHVATLIRVLETSRVSGKTRRRAIRLARDWCRERHMTVDGAYGQCISAISKKLWLEQPMVRVAPKRDLPKTTPRPSVPIRPSPEDTEGEWASAETPVRQGGVQVQVKAVRVGKVPLKSSFGASTGQSQDELLMIEVAVTNLSDTKKIDYRTWGGGAMSFRNRTALTDNFANSYRVINFGFSNDVVGAVESESIYPNKSLDDVLVFEKPIGRVEYLNLELPAAKFGGEGMLRLRIPAAMIQK